jgi:hypothetical protein
MSQPGTAQRNLFSCLRYQCFVSSPLRRKDSTHTGQCWPLDVEESVLLAELRGVFVKSTEVSDVGL